MATGSPLLKDATTTQSINDTMPQKPPQSLADNTQSLRLLTLPYSMLVWPFAKCMRLRCWEKRRYLQYDLSIQIMGIFQTLIGAIWASTLEAVIDQYNQTERIDISLFALYCLLVYIASNLVVIALQRHQYFSQRISFFVGVLGHVLAFGVKSLTLQIMYQHFSSSFLAMFAYFWLCLALSILFIYGISFLRKNACFAIR